MKSESLAVLMSSDSSKQAGLSDPPAFFTDKKV